VSRVVAAAVAGLVAAGLGVWAAVVVLTPASASSRPLTGDARPLVRPAPGPSKVCEPWPQCGLARLAEMQQQAQPNACLRAEVSGYPDPCPELRATIQRQLAKQEAERAAAERRSTPSATVP
jgi:hypothetical protein